MLQLFLYMYFGTYLYAFGGIAFLLLLNFISNNMLRLIWEWVNMPFSVFIWSHLILDLLYENPFDV